MLLERGDSGQIQNFGRVVENKKCQFALRLQFVEKYVGGT